MGRPDSGIRRAGLVASVRSGSLTNCMIFRGLAFTFAGTVPITAKANAQLRRTSAADLKSLTHSPQDLLGDFGWKAALESRFAGALCYPKFV